MNNRISHYIFENNNPKTSDTLKYRKHIDNVYAALYEVKVTIKIALLVQLWQQMVDFGLDATANYISNRYLLKLLDNICLLSELLLTSTAPIGTSPFS